MKTQVIQLSSNEINKPRNWKQFSHDPKRYDYIIDKIVPFMVSDPSNYIEKFKSTLGEESEINELRKNFKYAMETSKVNLEDPIVDSDNENM